MYLRNLADETKKTIMEFAGTGKNTTLDSLAHAICQNKMIDQQSLEDFYDRLHKKPSLLLYVEDYKAVSDVLLLMTQKVDFMNSDYTRSKVAEFSFFALSKLLDTEPKPEYHLRRLEVLASFHKEFSHTITKALPLVEEICAAHNGAGLPTTSKVNRFYFQLANYDFKEAGDMPLSNNTELLKQIISLQCNRCEDSVGKQLVDIMVQYLADTFKRRR